MKTWMRRIRAAAGIGLTWALAWFGAGMVLLFIVGFGAADVPFPLFFGFLGFLAGATFSAILGAVAGKRKFGEMSLPRFAGWGAAGGLLLSGIVNLAAGPGDLFVLAPVFALAGGISAAGTLALARRSEGRDLLEAAAAGSDARFQER